MKEINQAAAIARAEAAEAKLDLLRQECASAHEEAEENRERAETAERQLAALREAARYAPTESCSECGGHGRLDLHGTMMPCGSCRRAWGHRLQAAIADTTAAAEQYRAGVRAEMLREAADRVGRRIGGVGMQCGPHSLIEDWLRAMAEEEKR